MDGQISNSTINRGIPCKYMVQKLLFWTGLILLGCVINVEAKTPSGVVLTGTCESTSWNPSGDNVASGDYKFTVTFVGSSWSIRLDDSESQAGKLNGFDRVETTFNGEDLFRVVHFPDGTATNSTIEIKSKKLNSNEGYDAYGTVKSGMFSIHETPVEQILWLSFCSEKFLPLTKTNFPVLDFPLFKEDNIQKVDADYTTTLPHLPETMKVMVYGLYGFSREQHKFERIPLPSPFDKGFTAFELKTSSPMLHDSFSFPQNVIGSFFMVNPAVKPPKTFCSTRVKILVKTIASFDNGIALPNIQGSAVVVDSRLILKDKMPLRYIPTNGAWLSRKELSDPHLLDRITKEPALSGNNYYLSSAVNNHPIIRMVIIVAISLSSICIIIILFRSRSNIANKNTKV